MGVLDYQVTLEPVSSSPLYCGMTAADAAKVAATVTEHSHNVTFDKSAWENPDQALAYQSSAGLFQILIRLNPAERCSIDFSLRFALLNPPTVTGPFVETAAWLMQQFQLACRFRRAMKPSTVPPASHDLFEDVDALVPLLTASIVSAQGHWIKTSGVTESAIVKPGLEAAQWLSEVQRHSPLGAAPASK